MQTLNRASIAARDVTDPLGHFRNDFQLPEGVIYLDGNSLGALPKAVSTRVQQTIADEWGRGLVRSWNSAGWYEMPRRLGDKIGRLIGAQPGEVIVADSTSVNLFKVLAAAVKQNPSRRVILSEPDNFPTDLYMAQGVIDFLGSEHTLKLASGAALYDAIDAQTAVVMVTHANYRTGSLHDMAALTAQAHANGALIIWDLAHSAGALPIDLTGANVDFAIGCGYKYLNGGPGAPAFVYVPLRNQATFRQPLSGWMGHAQPFDFDPLYTPAEGIARYLCGTQPVLSMTALECAVDLILTADLTLIREKSVALTELFIALVEERCADHGLELVTPREPDRRGSQICLRHPDAYPIMQALIAQGVIGDFRAPDILRFGFTPLYVGYADVWDAVDTLVAILDTRAWDTLHFRQKAQVT